MAADGQNLIMKTPSPSKTCVKNTFLRQRSITKAQIRWWLGAIFFMALSEILHAAPTASACQKTSTDMAHSCEQDAQGDYLLALGKCDNVADPSAQAACKAQARTDKTGALRECSAVHGARQAACQKLGGAPYDPVINPANFVAQVTNPYFPLVPGTKFIYEGQAPDGLEHEEFLVTHNTKVILGVTCTEVRDTVTLAGQLIEDTRDWFAQDTSGNVWYFGELATQLENGLVVGVEGSWTGGVDGAKPGIQMKALPAVGNVYRQEFLLDTAEDIGEVVSVTETVSVPAGTFMNCVETKDTTPLEPDVTEFKFYAAGTGNVLEIDQETGERLELIQITTGN
jgi:hypothetical protein